MHDAVKSGRPSVVNHELVQVDAKKCENRRFTISNLALVFLEGLPTFCIKLLPNACVAENVDRGV